MVMDGCTLCGPHETPIVPTPEAPIARMDLPKRSITRLLAKWAVLVGIGTLLGLFLIGYLAAYVHPRDFWWPQLIAAFLPYFALAVLATSLLTLALWRRHRILLALHVVVIALVAERFIEPQRWLAQRAPSEVDLVVMTLNAPRFPEPDDAADEVVRLVQHHQVAVIGLQESSVYVSRRDPYRLRANRKFIRLIDEQGFAATLPGPVAANERFAYWRQPVLATIPITAQQQLVYQYGEKDSQPLEVLRTELEWQGRRVVHFNLHLHTQGRKKPWKEENPRLLDPRFWRPYLRMARDGYLRRAWQAERIRENVERETVPVIIAGDFNETVHHWSFRHIASGFQDAWAKAGRGWGGTFHTTLPLLRIDFVLAGPEWEVVSAVTPPTSRLVSDHRPVIARMRLRSWANDDP